VQKQSRAQVAELDKDLQDLEQKIHCVGLHVKTPVLKRKKHSQTREDRALQPKRTSSTKNKKQVPSNIINIKTTGEFEHKKISYT